MEIYKGTHAPFAQRSRGMTLVELLVALAIVFILAGMAVPSFAAYLDKQRVEVAASRFHAHMSVARNTAIAMGATATLEAKVENDWSQGWRVYVDRNGNDLQDDDEASVVVGEALTNGVTISGNGSVASAIRFGADGRPHLAGGGFQAGTITISNGCKLTQQLVMSRAGRVRRTTSDTPAC
jgi:type IV fimbrial biogenesis protein FimT